MKKKIVYLLFFIVFTHLFCENEIFKDITREHWAYKYVENLVYKGIIPRDNTYFYGDENITRYEMAEYLSKVLTKLDDEKASQEDIRILEKLVYEFSKELNSAGMDISQYVNRLKKLEEDKEKIEKKQNEIDEKIKKIEQNSYTNNKISFENNSNNKKLENIELTLKGNFYNKEDNLNKTNFYNKYEASIRLKQSNADVSIKYDSNENIPYIEGKYDKKISIINLHANTPGYNRDVYSFFDNLYYRSFCNDWETSLEHKYANLILLKNNESDLLTVIGKSNYKYYDAMILYDNQNKKLKYELTGVYDELEYFGIALGYSRIDDFSYVNLQGKYKNKDIFNLIFGYERKDDIKLKSQLYNLGYSKFKFNITENMKAIAKVDFFDTVPGTFLNYALLLKDKLFGLDIYISFENKKIEKEDTYSFDSINLCKENNKNLSIFRLKGNYKLNDKLEINSAYEQNDKKNWILTSELKYKIEEGIDLFLNYKKSNFFYKDIVRDIEGEFVDIDYNNKTFEIGENNKGIEKGRIEAGFELKF